MNYHSTIESFIEGEIDPAYAARARFIFEKIASTKPKRVLDIGCGRGFYIKMMTFCDFITEINGIDLREEHLVVARKNVEGDSRVKLQQGSIYELPFEDKSLDLVVCSEVLEHLEEPQRAVMEIRRVLSDGGSIVATVPSENFPMLWDPLNAFLMKFFNTHVHKDIHWLAGIWADHERLYTMEPFKDLFQSGYAIEESRSFISHCLPFSHFVIYGIGKNLVEAGFLKSLNRFTFDPPSAAKKMIAQIMNFPAKLLDSSKNKESDHGVILGIHAKKV